MKLLRIQIPMAQPNQTVTSDVEPQVKRAAFDELCSLIPALSELKGTTTVLGTTAVGHQLHLSVLLFPLPQLNLRLSDTDWKLGRVIELDETALDQAQVRASLLLTRDLLAAAEVGQPEAIQEWLEKFAKTERRRAVNRLRRDLGNRYEIDVFESPEVVLLPTLETTRLEDQERIISAVVTKMSGRTTFRAKHLTEIPDVDVPVRVEVDCRQVWAAVRRGWAQSFSSGQLIHESMERGITIHLKGHLVIHELTDSPVAIEVSSVSRA